MTSEVLEDGQGVIGGGGMVWDQGGWEAAQGLWGPNGEDGGRR